MDWLANMPVHRNLSPPPVYPKEPHAQLTSVHNWEDLVCVWDIKLSFICHDNLQMTIYENNNINEYYMLLSKYYYLR